LTRERDVSRDRRASACVAAAQPCGERDDSVTEKMVAKAAAVLEDYFECSPGVAKALAEDALHAALSPKNDEAQNAAIGSIARGIRALPHLRCSSLVPLYLLRI
jgi:hypothetical protein